MLSVFSTANNLVSTLIWVAIIYFIYKLMLVSKNCVNKGNIFTCYWDGMVKENNNS
jgi:hypothetical protein